MIAKADANPDLTPVAQFGPVEGLRGGQQRMVVPLTNQPVVATGADKNRDTWLELGTS